MTHEIELRVGERLPCLLCGCEALLAVRMPHAWQNAEGKEVSGWREFVLCGSCDAQDPDAAELLALFTVDERVTTHNMELFADLAGSWAEARNARTVDLEKLAEEEEAWRRGEL